MSYLSTTNSHSHSHTNGEKKFHPYSTTYLIKGLKCKQWGESMKRLKAGGEFFPLLSPGFGSTYCKIPKSQCFNYKHWAFSLLGHKLQPTGTTHQTQQQPHNQPINPLKTQPNSKPITTTNGKTCTNPTTNGHNHTTPKPPIELNQEREMWTQPRERERERERDGRTVEEV